MNPSVLASEAMAYVHEFNEANPRRNIRRTGVTQPDQPILSLFSIFVDAGCDNDGPTGRGMVVCNQAGANVLSLCKRENSAMDPLTAEALGIRWALQVASEHGFNSVSIHSDALNVVNCINRRSKFVAIELIAQDCRELMSSLLTVSVMFVSRNQNSAAHNLASLAKVVGDRLWVGSVPSNSMFSVSAAANADPCNHDSCVPALF